MAVVKRSMLTIEEAESYTGFGREMLHAAVKRGDLKATRPGRSPRSRLYFEEGDLDAWLQANQEAAS